MSDYKLDRNAHWAGKIEDQTRRNVQFWSKKTIEERLKASWYLTCMAYGIDPDNPPPMDKTKFSSRKHPK